MTTPDPGAPCAVCRLPATAVVAPPRRTLARGVDPSDDSYSVTVIPPDVALCADHVAGVGRGDVVIGWCDDERCRTYGEAGSMSVCGAAYERLTPVKPRPSK